MLGVVAGVGAFKAARALRPVSDLIVANFILLTIAFTVPGRILILNLKRRMQMKKSELKQMIEQVEDLHVTSINVPEWNFDVYVRMLSGDDIDAIGTAYQVTKDKSGVVAANNAFTDELLVRSLCDEDGNQLFDITELPSLKKKNGEALKRIVKESLRLNRLDKEGQDSAVKTSGADQTG